MKKLLSAVLVSALALGFSLSAASCSESKAYSSDLASLQQQITELQDKNQELKEQIDSISSQNDALKLQIEKLISSNEIPSYTLGDTVPCYVSDVKIFEMKALSASSVALSFSTPSSSLSDKKIADRFSAFIYDHTTKKWGECYEINLLEPSKFILYFNIEFFSGTKSTFLYFQGEPFAVMNYTTV